MSLLLLLIFGLPSYAVKPELVLKTAWQDGTYLSHGKLQATDSKNPFRNVEATFGYENNKKSESELGIKFNFKSWPEWQSGRSVSGQGGVMRETSLAWALRDRYRALLAFQLNEQRNKFLTDVSELSKKYFKAQAVSLKAGRATPKSFMGARGDLFKYQRSTQIVNQEQALLKKRLHAWEPQWTQESFLALSLPTVEEIAERLRKTEIEHPSMSKRVAEEELIELDQELRIVQGRDRQWVKSMELTYSEAKEEKEYKAELTLQIPFLGSDDLQRQKQNELILKKALKQRDIESNRDQLMVMKLQILNLVDIYKNMADSNVKIVKNAQDPLGSLEARLYEKQEGLELLNQQQEITMLYLDFLVESGLLSKHPEVNYLSKDQSGIL